MPYNCPVSYFTFYNIFNDIKTYHELLKHVNINQDNLICNICAKNGKSQDTVKRAKKPKYDKYQCITNIYEKNLCDISANIFIEQLRKIQDKFFLKKFYVMENFMR